MDKLAGRRRGAAMAALVVVLVVGGAGAARAEVRIDGRGWGHGAGLAQWGARGYAEHDASFRWILGHYYPGTSVAAAPSARMRVRLAQTRAVRVDGVALAVGANGRRVALRPDVTYRLAPYGGRGLHLTVATDGRNRAHLGAPVRLTGPAPLRLLGNAETGVADGRYRGALVASRAADEVLTVEDVTLESYLLGVVPAEMPSTWPAAALAAQAVAARSFALTSRRPAAAFDVYADTRSQAYHGVAGESAGASAAVRATKRLVVRSQGQVARTLFHASSGGWTAAVEEVIGWPAVPYLVSVTDPYDRYSPYHTWTVTLADAVVAQRLRTVLAGDLVDLRVVERTASGRARTVAVVGTQGTTQVDGVTIRRMLGLRSTWISVRVSHPVPVLRVLATAAPPPPAALSARSLWVR